MFCLQRNQSRLKKTLNIIPCERQRPAREPDCTFFTIRAHKIYAKQVRNKFKTNHLQSFRLETATDARLQLVPTYLIKKVVAFASRPTKTVILCKQCFCIFCDETKTHSLSPDGSENPLVPGFGIRDCNGQRVDTSGAQ